jgi:uncharacterized protein YuzE
MVRVASILPQLVAELRTELAADGGEDLVAQLDSCEIERCTYDPTASAGYIYLRRAPNPQFGSPHFEPGKAPRSETFALAKADINIDVDLDGRLIGFEILSRAEIFEVRRCHGMI